MPPAIRGVVDRRILINYRVPIASLEDEVPDPFRPTEVADGWGFGSVCIMRLKNERPRFVPSMFGTSLETITHRISVERDDGDGTMSCVYVPRRDTPSQMGSLVVGGLMPGMGNNVSLETDERGDRHHVRVDCGEGSVRASVEEGGALPSDSVFDSVQEAKGFFLEACVRYSPSGTRHEAVEFCPYNRNMSALKPINVESRHFEGIEGSELDSAFLMKGIKHEWLRRKPVRATATR